MPHTTTAAAAVAATNTLRQLQAAGLHEGETLAAGYVAAEGAAGAAGTAKTGIFRDHRCARCRDGALLGRCPTPDRPGNCGNPIARND